MRRPSKQGVESVLWRRYNNLHGNLAIGKEKAREFIFRAFVFFGEKSCKIVGNMVNNKSIQSVRGSNWGGE